MTPLPDVATTLVAALALAAVHTFAGQFYFLDYIPRTRWLSFAGGIPVAFVFLVILPTLASDQPHLAEVAAPLPGYLTKHAYLVALIGFVTFYGVEHVVKASKWRRLREGESASATRPAFWFATATFATLSLVIGYVLVQQNRTTADILVFTIAFAAKFFVQDRGLHEDHHDDYDRYGRWIMAAAVLLGWALGQAVAVPAAALAGLKAFILGGVILNVIKEELPQERESRLWAFLLGAGLYAGLLLLL